MSRGEPPSSAAGACSTVPAAIRAKQRALRFERGAEYGGRRRSLTEGRRAGAPQMPDPNRSLQDVRGGSSMATPPSTSAPSRSR